VLNQLLYVDAKTFLPDLNLAYSDKLSMACSIEVRVPFLDNEVVDFLSEVPPSLKIHHFTQKYLLKRSMDGILPSSVIHRRKAGFGLPVRAWLQGELRAMTRDLLSPERLRQRGQLNAQAVDRMLQENETGKVDHTYRIWALLTMEIWQQTFLEFSYEGSRLSSLDPVRSAAVIRTQ
jgi:asparagine synthase (glutamine-hydrolysing)